MKKLLLIVLATLLPLAVSAYSAYIGGIYYDFYNYSSEAWVTHDDDYNSYYSGVVNIPNKVTYNGKTYKVTCIGKEAFYGCSGLTSITIPNSVTLIEEGAFDGCSGLTSITIPNSVTSIERYAFYNCSGLTSITIPNSMDWISCAVFYGCRNLTSITIPNSVTEIGDEAFCGCSGLTSITIPESVTSIGNYAFYDCCGLTSIDVKGGNTYYDSRENCNAIIETATNTLIAGCQSTIIPNGVTSIGDGAFSGRSGLTSITIPNSVTSIGYCAFRDCSGLTSITIPNSVTAIGDEAFFSCSGLTSITIPNSVTSIGDYAFYNCSGLTSITIPNSVTNIGIYAFSGCTNLTSVTIPNSVTTIEYEAFAGCRSLTSVTIPNSVTRIDDLAFIGCTSLTDVYCYAENVPETDVDAFNGSPIASAILHVPAGSVDAYRTTSPWNNFCTIVAIGEDVNTGTIEIDSAEKLVNFATRVNAGENLLCALLTADIDLSGVTWTPIGNAITKYAGIFDGQGHTITGFNYTANADYNGLFGYINNATIKNFSISGILTSNYNKNGVVGNADGTSIVSGIHSSLTINVSNCEAHTGGIVGGTGYSGNTLLVENCEYSGILTHSGNGDCQAGILGYTHSGGVKNCIFSGTIIGENSKYAGILAYCKIPNFLGVQNCLSVGKIVAAEDCTTAAAIIANWNGSTTTNVKNNYYCLQEGSSANVVAIGNNASNCEAPYAVTMEQLASGEICYKLNGDQTEIHWYQTLREDNFPVPDNRHLPVYIINGSYINGSTITFDTNGGSPVENIIQCPGTNVTPPEPPTREGYSFIGWDPEIPEIMPTSDLTIVAQWQINSYILTYLLNGEVYSTETVVYGTTLVPEPNLKREGYSFTGWSEVPETMPAHDVIITGAFYPNGDVNADNEVDVVDVVDIARFVVGTPATTFWEVLADINKDGIVNIGDAVVLINDIAGNQNFVKAWHTPICVTAYDRISLKERDGKLSLNLENERWYTACQFDLYVPENIDVSKMMLNAERKHGHQLLYNKIENGHYRVAALSTSNYEFYGNDGELLNITLSEGDNIDASIQNIHFFDAEGHDYQFDDISSTATGVFDMRNSQDENDALIYDLQGRKLEKLHRGINIVGAKKIIVK